MFRVNHRFCARTGLAATAFHASGRLLKAEETNDAKAAGATATEGIKADTPHADKTVQVSSAESALPPDPVMDGLPPLPDPPRHPVRTFPHKGPRGNFTPEYYVGTAGAAGHPDILAEQLGAGRPDSEWMWLKLLCFICFMSTFGSWAYGVYFPEHIRYFQDEPWSKLPKSAL